MPSTNDVQIRPAVPGDVEAVKNLFVEAYGDDYPFTQFYDAWWLTKAVFDDDTLFLVAESGGEVLGTVSVTFAAGGLSDLVGEFGRLVVDPDARGKRIGSKLFEASLEAVSGRIQFGFAEARTAHVGSQKILERVGFRAVGFEPFKYTLENRESVVMYGRLFGQTEAQRRNNPRLIPEVAPVAATALARLGLEPDVVVVEEEHGYPTDDEVTVEDLSESGWSPLLRIERGRVKGRDVFGNLSLSHGFFKIKTDRSRYLVARERGAAVGGLGFDHDPIDRKVRIFELIGFSDGVKGRLLREAERVAREDLECVYVEIDVSAHAPALQRTLERMGFLAAAYCPAMVFEDVERLDVVRMAKLLVPYFREDIPLTETAGEIRDVVERSMADRRLGDEVARAAGSTTLFHGLDEGDMYHLARLGRVTAVAQGETLIRQDDVGDRLFILVDGALKVLADGREVGVVRPGETVGEIALLDRGPRSADVVATADATVVEILGDDLNRLMSQRPRLGMTVMHNLAANLSGKLRALDASHGGSSGDRTER